jgi:hypothetical protein
MKLALILLPFLLISCQSAIENAIKETKYSAYEMIGYQKRDLFKKEARNVKSNQEETGQSFKDALDRLKELYNFDGGNLEKQDRKLNSAYETAKTKADGVHSSVKQLETVAQDLFDEWKKEIAEISTPDLRAKSTAKRLEAKTKYDEFHASLKKSEAKLGPVLTKLHDQVLYLKHNLNAAAVTGLKAESGKVQSDIEALIKEMNSSISQTDEFIKTL